jgi:hypothetical protein
MGALWCWSRFVLFFQGHRLLGPEDIDRFSSHDGTSKHGAFYWGNGPFVFGTENVVFSARYRGHEAFYQRRGAVLLDTEEMELFISVIEPFRLQPRTWIVFFKDMSRFIRDKEPYCSEPRTRSVFPAMTDMETFCSELRTEHFSSKTWSLSARTKDMDRFSDVTRHWDMERFTPI